MTVIDADKFLAYLIYSKHIDGLTCGEVKEVVEMCKVDVLDKISAEIQENINYNVKMDYQGIVAGLLLTLDIIDKYRKGANEWK